MYDVVVPLVVSGGLVAVLFASSLILRNALTGRDRSEMERTATLGKRALSLVSVSGAAIVGRLAFPGGTLADAMSIDDTTVTLALQVLAITGIALAGLYAIRRGLEPIVADLRGDDYELPRGIRRRNRVIVGCAVLVFASGVELPAAGIGPLGPVWSVALGAALAASVYLPFATPRPGLRARSPTDGERERIERCYERFDRSPPFVLVSESGLVNNTASVRGHGDRKSLVVKASLLNGSTDDELAVVLAEADERNRNRYWEFHYWQGVVLVGILVWAVYLVYLLFTGGIPTSYFAGLALAVPALLLGHVGRRVVYRADRNVCERLGAETVRSTYETRRSDVEVTPEYDQSLSGRILSVSLADPPLERRLDRLDRRDDPTQNSGSRGNESARERGSTD